MKFQINNPDYCVSPYTGMTKQHWLDACEFLLDGIFSNMTDAEDLPLSKRVDFEISYPNINTAPWKDYGARFEGLARSFLIAAPLLYNRPEVRIRGYALRDYYQKHILGAVTRGHPSYMLSLDEVKAMAFPGERAFQHTCECASLVIGLDQCREVLWHRYTQAERDRIAGYLSAFAHGPTSPHNWRLFNMLIMGFLHREGYPVNQDIMRDHGQVILSYYAGDGWYRDGHRFDYYSAWAFQVYGPIWNVWYGYEYEPDIAARIERYSHELMKCCGGLFDRNGHVTLWGRSGIYRNAAAAPFAANFLLSHPMADPGLARRINSGALLQFITKEEVFVNGVPALGFYGQFLPLVQEYSCAESPFWMGNPFLCLCFADNHPFWTATEKNGDWELVGIDDNHTYLMPGPGIAADHHGGNGAVELRTAKILLLPEDDYIPLYVRLSFHSHFLLESFDHKGPEAMIYSLQYDEQMRYPNLLLYGGMKAGVLYRRLCFDFQYSFQGCAMIDLADFPVAMGMVRVDKLRIHEKPFTLFMGAYGFPADCPVQIEERTKGNAAAIILKGGGRQQALVIYSGFDGIEVKERKGVHPAADKSLLLYGVCRGIRRDGYGPYIMISLILSKDETEAFTEDELFPISDLKYQDREGLGGYGPVTLYLADGKQISVDYEGLEGTLTL